MQLDVNKIIEKYKRIVIEQASKIILLEVENEQLKELLQEKETKGSELNA